MCGHIVSTDRFQFTPLREGRQTGDIHHQFPQSISIHAPPRGATNAGHGLHQQRNHFNSRPSARGDHSVACCAMDATSFQFTPLREGRRAVYACVRVIAEFQFTPLREGRHACDPCYITITRFQFTPLREGRQLAAETGGQSLTISIHAPPRGATTWATGVSRFTVFQFTPLREGRPTMRVSKYGSFSISIHAPPRGATAKDMQFLQIFCSTLTNQHGLTIVPRNLSRLFW